ncbi:MAG: hypothetical protein WC786_06605 [Patescibacteria group bacterium]|jgi:hypothetical protein
MSYKTLRCADTLCSEKYTDNAIEKAVRALLVIRETTEKLKLKQTRNLWSPTFEAKLACGREKVREVVRDLYNYYPTAAAPITAWADEVVGGKWPADGAKAALGKDPKIQEASALWENFEVLDATTNGLLGQFLRYGLELEINKPFTNKRREKAEHMLQGYEVRFAAAWENPPKEVEAWRDAVKARAGHGYEHKEAFAGMLVAMQALLQTPEAQARVLGGKEPVVGRGPGLEMGL